MHRCVLLILAILVSLSVCTDGVAAEPSSTILAQTSLGVHDIDRGPGGYLAWYKILIVVIVFFVWIRVTDWMNRDAQLIGADTDLPPELWNPLSLGAFLLGFWAALSIPIFWVGLPVFLFLAFTPFTIFFLIRRSKFIATPSLKNKLSTDPDQAEILPQDEGIEIKFAPAGSGDDKQKNLIRARRATAFGDMKNLIHDGTKKRAEVIMLDYSRDRVAARMMIDGAWHPLPPLSRETGDSMLVSLKHLAGLDPNDRRSRQQGQFGAALTDQKMNFDLTSQGTKSGERVQLKFIQKRKTDLTMAELGMWPDMIADIVSIMGKAGMVIVSSPPREGLTTTWRAVLGGADRITRDWIGIVDKNEFETDVENVAIHRYDKEAGQTPNSVIRKILLSQPDALVMPELSDSESLDAVVNEAAHQDRTVVTKLPAKNAADAVIRMLSLAEDKRLFIQALKAVTGQKLARRLCDNCKVPVQVQPKLIQQLGGDPRKTNTLYNSYQLPPVEQRVDENGRPIEMLPCKVCGGIGFIGRISIYEMIHVSDNIREALLKSPRADLIRQLATKNGDLPMLKQGYRLVLLGITSLSEIQRVMKD